jgi:putative DNA primase/helicase
MPKINVVHDAQIDLATTSYRKKPFKNTQWYWSDLITKLSETHRTHETYDAYIKMGVNREGKDRQAEIKDVGGFVGGYLTGGKRQKDKVKHRQLITLDVDFLSEGDNIWTDFTFLYENAACMYTTHKHSPDAPRVRLVIPLDRPVSPMEYEAIARKIASNLGIDRFDRSTYEAERLMYWPSTSVDGEYLFEVQDGRWLSADEILKSYVDWSDESAWPLSKNETEIVHKSIKKLGDPREKDNIVGYFCSVYGITEAIEKFIPEMYEASIMPDRMSYVGGSTSNGLKIYNNLFSYSHHGTDPSSGHACNAFDLVRIHKFGELDRNQPADTPIGKLPSFLAMTALAAEDPEVKKVSTERSLKRIEDDFKEFAVTEHLDKTADKTWMKKLNMDKKGVIQQTIYNVALILKNDPNLAGRLARNIFENKDSAIANLPWRKVDKNTKYITDDDDSSIKNYLERVYKITNRNVIQDGVRIHFSTTTFHPVRDYLDKLIWDGVQRVDDLLIKSMGAPDSAYVQSVTRKTLVAAVARVMQPGIKFDHVLTLISRQGLGKSSIIKRLGRQWFSDSFGTVQGKEAYEQIQGVWLVEIAELAGLRKAEIETIKHFISKQEDKYRVAYGRRVENFPRQCVFIASTNDEDFLKDPTGNRRFWPVVLTNQFKGLTNEEVDQIWAEAVHYYEADETLYLDPEMEAQAMEVQLQHTEQDGRAGLIYNYLNMKLPPEWDKRNPFQRYYYFQNGSDTEFGTIDPKSCSDRTKVCAAEIWCEALKGDMKDFNAFNCRSIHNIMRNMPGWIEATGAGKKRFGYYGIQKAYVRSNYVIND